MPVAAYSRWERAGRPITPAAPVRDLVGALEAAYPQASGVLGWYADDSHYQAVPAEDHTPYSQTAWPVSNPEWYVFATDIMHRPDLGVDCNVLFPYWLSEARAGRIPSLKYLIYQAKLYDVRNGFSPVGNSEHFDHVHWSFRSDFATTGLGGWGPIPGGDDVLSSDVVNLILTGVSSDGNAGASGDAQVRDHVPGQDIRSVEARLNARLDELVKLIKSSQGGGVTPAASFSGTFVAKAG